MINKITLTMILFTLTIITSCRYNDNELLNQYYPYHIKSGKIDSQLPLYNIGPLFMLGYTTSEMEKMVTIKSPTKIGEIESNKIILSNNEYFNKENFKFKKVIPYKIVNDKKSFYILYTNAVYNSEKYEIVIELKGTGDYRRVIKIYKNKKPYTMILWV